MDEGVVHDRAPLASKRFKTVDAYQQVTKPTIIATGMGRCMDEFVMITYQGVLNVDRMILIVGTISREKREYNSLCNQLSHVNDNCL